ncbi:MAG: glycine cleavage system protein GcvH [Armatimonadetes bacterium]|nr:glycine cleavage system protein GcvH [Armatimonadota bacterium]
MNVPAELLYLSSHEWCRVEGDTCTVGITDYAQHELGDIVYVELPQVGALVDGPGAVFGAIDSVKAAEELRAPVRGEIVEVHEELQTMIEQINLDPYGQGWMIRIKVAEPADLEGLLDADSYRALCESESH